MKTVSRSGVSVLLGVGCGLLVFAMLRNGVQAQESKDLVSIQARVLQDGVPTNVDLEVQFEAFDAPTSGTLLWGPEAQTCQVRNGILSAKLGAVVALGDTFKGGHSTSDRYIAIKVAGVEIVPRIRLTAVPYSHRASSAEIASQLWSGSAGLSITDLDARYVNNAAEIAGTGLEDDGSGGDGALRIASAAAGNGLTGGSGTPLAVNPAALINGGVAVIDGDLLEVDYTPTNYARTTGTPGSNVKDLTAHLRGIDSALLTSGGTGTVLPGVAGGRLTVSSTDPVTTADVNSSTLYYLPFADDKVALHTGSAWAYHSIPSGGVSASVTGLTAAVVHDVFLHDASGTLTLSFVAWTNDTTRSVALSRQNGAWVKATDTTRRYLGTVYTYSNGGTTNVRDGQKNRDLWNVQNRVERVSASRDDTTSWTYDSSTWRGLNNGDADWRFDFVVGLGEEPVETYLSVNTQSVNTGSSYMPRVALGIDSTTIPSTSANHLATTGAGSQTILHKHVPTPGRHYVNGLESITNTGGNPRTFYGGEDTSILLMTIRS